MAKRLAKVAKELNVGTSTIVEFLQEQGFEIENKPTTKITEEMEAKLLAQFQKSRATKEQADQLVIGTRPLTKKASEPEKKPTLTFATPGELTLTKKKIHAEAAPKEEAPAARTQPSAPALPEQPREPEPAETTAPAEEEDKPRIGLKVLGKIDLDKTARPGKSKKKKEEEQPASPPAAEETRPTKEEKAPVAEAPAPQTPPAPAAESDKAPEQPDQPAETPAPARPAAEKAPTGESAPSDNEAGSEENTVIRAKTPELRGLKILGKIDVEDKKPRKKESKKAKPVASSDDEAPGKRRRRRKRKKVEAESGAAPKERRKRRGRKRGEETEVTQKEIEEKIKETMARLSGEGKKKRQRLRRAHRERAREKQELLEMEQATEDNVLEVTEFVSVQELANLLDVSPTEIITTCMNLGVIVSINQRLDAELIELVASEYGKEVKFIDVEEAEEEEVEEVDNPEDLEPRAPIVTVMGHVDHGKTTLLDYIRNTNVAAREAGGITQHIGAYEVVVGEDQRRITFLDTPGHEAFTAMRARGAKVTDIAIIIIAADDSIMPQTREAISHAQAAGVPMIFAINKIDKPGANPEKIKQELASMNILVEDWGGEYQCQEISAKTGQGVDELLEKVLLVADLLELKANPRRKAIGTVLEAALEKGRGYVAKTLIQNGTLHVGDPIVAGQYSGKVRAMFDEWGNRVKEAGPAKPVAVLGLNGAPQAGERFRVVDSEQEARQIAARRAQILREQATRAQKRISLDEIGRRLALGTFKELNLIVKGDVDGSVEALSDSLLKLSHETVQVNVIHKAVGQITESDVLLASASDAIIVGFQVRPSVGARKLAEREGVQIKLYSIIYEAIEEIKSAIEGMLEPKREEQILGTAEVRQTFKISKVGTVAGCFVSDGKIIRNGHVRVIRDGIVIYPTKEGQHGEILSLKRFKEDVKEVRSGMECGISIKNFNDIKVGDEIECYEVVEVKQTL